MTVLTAILWVIATLAFASMAASLNTVALSMREIAKDLGDIADSNRTALVSQARQRRQARGIHTRIAFL